VLIAVLLALTLVAAPHPAVAGIVALAYLSPPGFLLAAAGWAGYHARLRGRARRRLPAAEADFLRGVAGEVDAGASIRQAVIAAADRAPALDLAAAVRLAAAGRPAPDVARCLQAALPLNGRLAAAAYQMVAETGARASDVFAGLAVRAADSGDLERERRALTAQTRLSAWLVGGLPVAVTVVLGATGRGPGLTGAGGLLTALGMGMIGLGGMVVWLMVRST
jgi:tight adherence protein B